MARTEEPEIVASVETPRIVVRKSFSRPRLRRAIDARYVVSWIDSIRSEED